MLMIVDRVKHMVGYESQVKNPDVLNRVSDHDGPNYEARFVIDLSRVPAVRGPGHGRDDGALAELVR